VQTNRFGQLRLRLVGLALMQQMQPEAKARVRLGDRRLRQLQPRCSPARVQYVHAGSATPRPISNGVEVQRLDAVALRDHVIGDGKSLSVHRPEAIRCTGGFGRADDVARFVDPHCLGHVHQVVQVGQMMFTIDQARVRRRGCLDPGPGSLRLIHRNGQHDETMILEFVEQ